MAIGSLTSLSAWGAVTGGVASNDISDMAGFDSAKAIFGASFSIGPVNIKIPIIFWIILTVIAVLVAAAFFASIVFKDFRIPVLATVLILVSSLVVGIAGVGDAKKLGRIGLKTIIYFEIVTTVAIVVGLLLAWR